MPYRYPLKFGKYLLTRRIAVGGMAEVFKGKLIGIKGFEKTLAIKRILPEFNEDEDFVQMFVDEARISSNLHHPNIVQVFDFGEVDRAYYMAMEYIDGPNLKNFLQRALKEKGRLPRNLALHIVMKVAKALEYAHSVRIDGQEVLNLVHRDVSPQNVLIARTGEIKITDFGIAKAAIKLSRTQPGKIQGKFSYMSPEQAAGLPLDHRSDIFSLGIIGFELLTGIKLYGLEDTHKRYKQVREARVPRLGTLVPDLPAQVEDLIMRMLSKDQSDRPQSCSEVISELNEFLSTISTEHLSMELGEFVSELFPPEKSDSGISRKVDDLLAGGQVAGEPGTDVAIDRVPGINRPSDPSWNASIAEPGEKTQPSGSLSGLPKFMVTLAVLMPLLAGAAYLYYRKQQQNRPDVPATNVGTATAPTDPEIENLSEPQNPEAESHESSGPVDSDLRAAAAARDAEIQLRLSELQDQVSQAQQKADAAEQRLASAEKKLVEVAEPAPPQPCPPNMVLIKSGEFLFGSSSKDANRDVNEPEATKISVQSFCVDTFEHPNRKGALPTIDVSWNKSQEMCAKAGKRLCSQEEWERSCKGPNTVSKGDRMYPYGSKWDASMCNTEAQEDRTVERSGTFSKCKTPENVFDMSGNVDEWTGSPGRFRKESRVTRGGSSKRPSWASRCTSVRELEEATKQSDIGFRCCKDAS